MPMLALPGRAIALSSLRFSAEDLARRLRTGETRVLGRIEQDQVLLDLRVADPRRMLAPVVDMFSCDHSSGSTLTLIASFHRSARGARAVDMTRISGATTTACVRTCSTSASASSR